MRKKIMIRKQLHIEVKNLFSPEADYTISGAYKPND